MFASVRDLIANYLHRDALPADVLNQRRALWNLGTIGARVWRCF